MVGGEGGPDLVVGHDRQVDEESEDTSTNEVPEPDCNEEHHRPAMRERRRRPRLTPGSELHESPRLDCEERQWDNLRSREEGADGHVRARGAREVQVVHGAEHPTGRVEDDVHVDDTQRHLLADDTEHDEDVRHHDGGEELEEVLDPEMDHPETPELGYRQLSVRPGEETHSVEHWDRQGREEKHPRHIADRFGPHPGTHGTPNNEHPQEHAKGEQELEHLRQVDVLPLLAEDRTLGPRDSIDR